MSLSRLPVAKPPSARIRLLEAARDVIRAQGYSATSVDDLCREAGVTKGAFFHHFASKEVLGVAAADFWSETTSKVFAGAPYHDAIDPLDRIFGYLDLRMWMVGGDTSKFTCLAGTMAQEIFQSHPAIRDAAYASIAGHAKMLEADLAEALALYDPPAGVTAQGLSLHIQTVLQGSFVIAKAKDDPEFTVESLLHLKRYVALLFGRDAPADDPAHRARQDRAMRAHLESLFWTND